MRLISPLLTGSFIPQNFTDPLLCGRPCVSSGDTRRSRTPPHLELRSRSHSHRRKVERHTIGPQNRQYGAQRWGSRRSTRVLVLEQGPFEALGTWAPSVGDDGNEPEWWQQPDCRRGLMSERKVWNQACMLEVHLLSNKSPGSQKQSALGSEQVDPCFFLPESKYT